MTRRLSLLVLPLLVLLAGCSGGGGAVAVKAKADYLERAEAVCATANTAQQQLGLPASAAAVPAYVRRVVAVASTASRDLDALTPPAADRRELEAKLLAPLREQVGKGEVFAAQVDATARQGDDAAVLRLLGTAPLQTTADLDWMRSYGFSACVDAVDTSS
jgi:hypothetical protein